MHVAARQTERASTEVIRRGPRWLLQFWGLQLNFQFRLHLTFLCAIVMCLAARADVIRLKNGKTIVTDSARESNGRIEYTIGENSFSIPGELVEKIDTSSQASVPAPAQPAATAAVEKPAGPSPGDVPVFHEKANQELLARVIHDGRIDAAAIQSIENEGVPVKSAAANYLAGSLEIRQSRFADAARYFEKALHYQPDQPFI